MSVYTRLPGRFDFNGYYMNQAGGGPSFPIYRARQRGGFLAPFLRRHGIPFLKWIGKQAASLASGVGNQYLEKGSLSKSDLKQLLKQQGKKTAHSALDNIKQQVGSGATMNFRRDGRLSTLIPTTTRKRDGAIAPLHGIRPPFASEASHSLGSPPDHPSINRPVSSRKKRKTTSKRKPKKRTKKPAKGKKKKSPSKTKKTGKTKGKKKLNKGLLAVLNKKRKATKSKSTIFDKK